MASHRAMKDLAENPEGVRALARSLLSLGLVPLGQIEAPVVWTDWELDFLDSMATRESSEPLSMRQREVLSELKAGTERHARIHGFAVPALIERTWTERLDLDDDEDIAFIELLRASGARTVTGRQQGRLLRLARATGLIEDHHAFA